MKSYDEAHAIADQLAKDLPNAPAAEILRGDTLQAQGKQKEAVDAFVKAFEKRPGKALILKLILAEQRAGLSERAKQRAERWLQDHPDDSAVRSVLAASTHLEGDESAAMAQYEQVLEHNPRNVVALNNLAWLYDRKGDPRALDLAKRANDILPNRAEVADTYGWLLVKSGQIEKGLAIIERAVEQAPDNGDIRYHHAAALYKAGETERARQVIEKLLAEVKTFSERGPAEALAKILR
jgi:Flp pilus assembly protein TadD